MKQFVLGLVLLLVAQVAYADSLTIWGEEFPPFGMLEEGQPAGLSSEIVQHLLNDSGVVAQRWTMAPWARAHHETLQNANTLLYTVVRKPDREDLFHWIGPISDRKIYLFKLRSRQDIDIQSWDDVKSYTVGVMRGTAMSEQLKSRGILTEEVAKEEFNIKRLKAGRIDLLAQLDYTLAFLSEKFGYHSSLFEPAYLANCELKFYIVLNKETSSDIVMALQASFEKIQASGELEAIKKKYLP